jgi:hypothetical protein
VAIAISFSKAKAQEYLDCLVTGKAVVGPWTAENMLALAGACYFAVMSHGPVRLSDRDWETIPAERREAAESTFLTDLTAAVEFYAELCMRVRDGNYDRLFEPKLRGVVWVEDWGKHFHAVEGLRPSN